uniref:Uncharacterized protein n=1 Tax=Astyanax mexicanus TaxID=7994 RepID=A0A3B1IW67_ASTMX
MFFSQLSGGFLQLLQSDHGLVLCHIISEQLLKTGVPQMKWSALSPDLNPTENRVQPGCHVEAGYSVSKNLNDLRAGLQEEWDAMPQQTISRLLESMRRCCQAVIDAQGWFFTHVVLTVSSD